GMADANLIVWKAGDPAPIVPADPLLLRYLGASLHPTRRAAIQHLAADLVEAEVATPAQVRVLVAVGRAGLALERARTVARDLLDRGEVVEAMELLQAVLPSADLPSTPLEQRLDVHMMF